MQKPLFCTTLATLALACGSCGHSTKLYPVTGKVTVNGTPAAGATVIFQRQSVDLMNEQTVMGSVRENGSFSLVCGPYGEGAPPGDYDVFIEWRHRAERAKGPMVTDRLKGHYADRNHPRLHARINPEPTDLPPFDLTEVTLTKADLKPDPVGAVPGRKRGDGKPHLFINGKEVDPATAEKIFREGPGGKKIEFKAGPGGKGFMFKKGDAEPDQIKQKAP
jgi:hypothetical protein